jgi:hypothetical protein
MNLKNTWLLLFIAALLSSFIVAWNKFVAGPSSAPVFVLPGFKSEDVTSIQVRTAGQPEILAARTNGGWRLTKPVPYPAQSGAIEGLLSSLSTLKPDAFLSAHELKAHPDAETEFGFDAPLATMILASGTDRKQVILGARTAPGDQLFVEVVGVPGIHLISTNLLRSIPSTPSDWRDTALLAWDTLTFNRVVVKQEGRTIELQRNATNHQWRLLPLQSRADSLLVERLLSQLRRMRVAQFITDDPRADLDAYGLHAPEMEVTFANGTNTAASLRFGRPVASNSNLVYLCRSGFDNVVAVSQEWPAAWRASAADLRDRHLVAMTALPARIEVAGVDRFTLVRGTNAPWRVLPQGFTADTNTVNEFLASLARIEVVQFVKDVVLESALTNYGLATPQREYTLIPDLGSTNASVERLMFGAIEDNNVYARRADEDSVYAVKRADFERLPAASWELRDRHIWQFTENDVASVLIEQDGRKRELVRSSTNTWSLAPGSFGIINTFGVEETVHRAGELTAAFWAARGNIDRARFGFGSEPRRLTFTLKDGTKHQVEFGGDAPSGFPYALVTIDGEPWLFEFPWTTWQYIQTYLSIAVREL